MPFRQICLLILSFLLITLPSAAQEGKETDAFPASWTGKWKGNLKIYNADGLAQSVPMELHILPVDSAGIYTWTIIYGPDPEAGKRPYLLKPVNPEKGIYSIDEQNTIVMENYLLGNKLFGRFEVMGSLLLSTVEKRGETLTYEIISGSTDPASNSGDTEVNGEDIPPVKDFPVTVRQYAELSLIR